MEGGGMGRRVAPRRRAPTDRTASSRLSLTMTWSYSPGEGENLRGGGGGGRGKGRRQNKWEGKEGGREEDRGISKDQKGSRMESGMILGYGILLGRHPVKETRGPQ
jgi:hypothetical protein